MIRARRGLRAGAGPTLESDLPEGWTLKTLADVTVEVPNARPEREPDRQFGYIDISSISNATFSITGFKTFKGSDAPSRARRPIQPGDVLFCNVRTYLRNVAIVPEGLNADLCSTGFTVLRSNGTVLPEFLFHYLLTADFINRVTERQTGSNYPAVSDRIVRAEPIPLPPLAEQHRIVAQVEALLARVNGARERLSKVPMIMKRFRQSLLAAACSGRLTEDLRAFRGESPHSASSSLTGERNRKSSFAVMTDLPAIPEEWTWASLPRLGELSRGKSRHRPRNAPHLYGGPYPFIQTGDVAQSRGRITEHRQMYSEAGLAQSRMWPAGTVCITIAANIAESGILTYPACFPDSLVGFLPSPDLCLGEYIEFFMRTAREDLARFAPATAQANINIAILGEVMVPVPPRDEQCEIVRRVEALFKLADVAENHVKTGTAMAEEIARAILVKAFRGELVATEAELSQAQGQTCP